MWVQVGAPRVAAREAAAGSVAFADRAADRGGGRPGPPSHVQDRPVTGVVQHSRQGGRARDPLRLGGGDGGAVFEVAAAGPARVVHAGRPRGDGVTRLRPRGDGVPVQDVRHDVDLHLVHVRVVRRDDLPAQVGSRDLDQGVGEIAGGDLELIGPPVPGQVRVRLGVVRVIQVT